jgi:hypothetical protein
MNLENFIRIYKVDKKLCVNQEKPGESLLDESKIRE